MMSEVDEPIPELMTREEILIAAQTESDHKGNVAGNVAVNNELLRTQINQSIRLENQMNDLEQSINSFKNWSRGLTILLIIISAALFIQAMM